jgi:cytochrome c oxidase assembly protein subunit 15
VESAIARVRTLSLSPWGFARLATATWLALFVVVTSGAFVRLTGSGLGCENWPRCGSKPFPERGYHAFVEFGNRMVALVGLVLALVTWLAARRMDGLSRNGRLATLGAFLFAAAQVPLGAVTIALNLNPLAVMAHFLLGLTVLALGSIAVIEALVLTDGIGAPAGPRWLRSLAVWAGLPATVALVVTGAIATASGPHPGASVGVKRLGLTITDTVYVHVRVVAAFGIGLLIVGFVLARLRGEYPGIWRLWLALLAAFVAQGVVGEVQYHTHLPWWLVLVHVSLAATIWTLALAVAYTLWRPPARLTRREVL